jgi:hypothetical protein
MQLQLGSSGTLLNGASSWGQAAEFALSEWNGYLRRVSLKIVRDSTAARADGNAVNNVFWSSSVFGRSFDGALAVTTSYSRSGTRTEADVIFNTAYSWNAYSGPLKPGSPTSRVYDFERVALHEFGHVLGLDHPDEAGQSVSAVMNSRVSDQYALSTDDKNGALALYGGGSAPPPTSSAPGAPSGFAASAAGATISLTWRAPSTGGSPTTYVVEAGSSPGGVNLANFSTGNTSTSFSAGGIGAGVYYVRVKAGNSVGTSSASNEATLVVGGGGGPCVGAPGAPGALFVTGNSGGRVSFSWSASSGNPTTYIIEAGSTPGTANLANSDLGGTATTFTATGVGRGTYFVRLRARNTCGTSGVSNEVTLIVP